MIIFLWAMTKEGVIGKKNQLPWIIPDELKHFKKTTINKTILMGRKTFTGIGKTLPERKTIILTRDKNFCLINADVKIIHSFNSIINEYYNNVNNDIYICGGSEIFNLFLPYAEKLIVSIIKKNYQGDIYFPKIDFSLYNLEEQKNYDQFQIFYYKRKEN